MTHRRNHILLLAVATLLLTGLPLCSQTPAPAPQAQSAQPAAPRPLPNFYRNLVVIDPAHGGPDAGAHLADNALEKDVTLAFAQRLRPALAAQGFAVTGTRDSDPAEALSTDQRAGIANHARPLACLVLHASASGSGVHVASSALAPADEATPRALHWSDAQAATLGMSLKLANELGLALTNAHLPVTLLRASAPPIDNLICPAAIIEIAPLVRSGGSRSAVTDAAYQQHVAEAIAAGLASFRTHNAPSAAAKPSAPPLLAPSAGAPR